MSRGEGITAAARGETVSVTSACACATRIAKKETRRTGTVLSIQYTHRDTVLYTFPTILSRPPSLRLTTEFCDFAPKRAQRILIEHPADFVCGRHRTHHIIWQPETPPFQTECLYLPLELCPCIHTWLEAMPSHDRFSRLTITQPSDDIIEVAAGGILIEVIAGAISWA